MIDKICTMLSLTVTMVSLMLAPFVAIAKEPDLIPFLIWMIAVILSIVHTSKSKWGRDNE